MLIGSIISRDNLRFVYVVSVSVDHGMAMVSSDDVLIPFAYDRIKRISVLNLIVEQIEIVKNGRFMDHHVVIIIFNLNDDFGSIFIIS